MSFGSIEKSGTEKPPKTIEQISNEYLNSMEDLSILINTEAGENILDEEGCVRLKAFKNEPGFNMSADKKTTYETEKNHAGYFDESAKNYFKKQHNLINTSEEALMDKMVESWKEKRRTEKSHILEMMVTALLHKILGKDYLIVRSSPYDDLENGVDNLLINRETGEALCGFDEINSYHDNKRLTAKMEKINKKMIKSGGVDVGYGLTFENGHIKKASFDSLPNFCLSLDNDDTDKAFQEVNPDIKLPATDTEIQLVKKIFQGVEQQIANLVADKGLNQKTRDKVKNFQLLAQKISEM